LRSARAAIEAQRPETQNRKLDGPPIAIIHPAAAPTAAWFSDLKHQGGRLLHAVALLLPFAPTLAGRMVRPSGLPVSLGPGR